MEIMSFLFRVQRVTATLKRQRESTQVLPLSSDSDCLFSNTFSFASYNAHERTSV